MKDLWPKDFKEEKDSTDPATILKEQAEELGGKTQNILKAEVKLYPQSDVIIDLWGLSSDAISEIQKYKFRYDFNIVAPAFNNYKYRLFSIGKNIDDYPLKIYAEKEILDEILSNATDKNFEIETDGILVDSEDKFLTIIEIIFNSNRTKRLINILLSLP